jgi:hypothetical protein
MKRLFMALVAAVLALVAANTAHAELVSEVSPIHGHATTLAPGWTELLVRITNTDAMPARGQIEAFASSRAGSNDVARTTAAYAVGGNGSVNVRLPVLVSEYTDVTVRVLDSAKAELHTQRYSVLSNEDVFLLDVHEPSTLRSALNELAISTEYAPPSHGRGGSGRVLRFGSPRMDPTTGDPLLPDRSSVYGSVDAVLMHTNTLTRLQGAELDALSAYVASGGTLALVPARPEDLRHATLVALIGGEVTPTSVNAKTLAALSLNPPAAATPSDKPTPSATAPSERVAATLQGYSGGNLHGSAYGATAAYGLGEVHLLGFDPTARAAAEDPWVQVRIVDLTRRAFNRRATVILAPGAPREDGNANNIHRELDPSANSRWGIAVAAIVLCLYALIAAPLNFTMAARKNRPLIALRRLVVLALVAFGAVVAIGIFARGIRGKARHLTLIEAGAGMTQGAIRRYRGFFSASTEKLVVRSTQPTSLLARVTSSGDASEQLTMGREGAQLEQISALPWQTVVVREDDATRIGDGISIVEDAGELVVANRSGRALRSAILKPAGKDPIYFARIDDGERVRASAGRVMTATQEERDWIARVSAPVPVSWGLMTYGLVAEVLPRELLDGDTPGIARAWVALQNATNDPKGWFPEDVPVLLAQLEGGEGRTTDSGLRVDRDRVLVRVVGLGGRP